MPVALVAAAILRFAWLVPVGGGLFDDIFLTTLDVIPIKCVVAVLLICVLVFMFCDLMNQRISEIKQSIDCIEVVS